MELFFIFPIKIQFIVYSRAPSPGNDGKYHILCVHPRILYYFFFIIFILKPSTKTSSFWLLFCVHFHLLNVSYLINNKHSSESTKNSSSKKKSAALKKKSGENVIREESFGWGWNEEVTREGLILIIV